MCMSEEEKESYRWKNKPKFASKRHIFLQDSFNKDGKAFFKDKYDKLSQHTRNHHGWTALANSWDDFVKTSGYRDFYVEHKEYEEEDDDDLDLPMSLPGSSTFVKDGDGRTPLF